MAKQTKTFQRFSGGLSDYSKESLIENSYYLGRCIDHRTDPRSIKLLPKTIKESGNVVTDLPLWAETTPDTNTYLYGDTGNIYKRTSAQSYSLMRTIADSHGNGLAYFQEDDFIYYASDTKFGRYGPVQGTAPQFVDDLLGSQGGTPQNTNSLDLEASSSQYASRADTTTLSITGNLSIECYIKPESLPAAGASMTLVSKWNESGALRSYKFDIATTSNYFGDGSDGALTISADTTEAPIDSACTGTIATTSLSATNASFAANQIILIHQTQGTGAGTWERNKIVAYTAGTITTESALKATYTTGAQVRVLKQYTNVTINSGKVYTAKAWNGTVGGILAFLASGTVTVTGTITAKEKGFRGGTSLLTDNTDGWTGEGTTGVSVATQTTTNGNGGGGGHANPGEPYNVAGGGGGGGNGVAGSDGTRDGLGGDGGLISGSTDLTTMNLGGGGGGGGSADTQLPDQDSGAGANGGGIIFICGATLTVTGSVVATGGLGDSGDNRNNGAGGGGAGGSILLKAQTATLGSALITATGGLGGTGDNTAGCGGTGSVGRIHLDYSSSYTGTTSPTLDVTLDNSIGTTTGYILRLTVSGNGTATSAMSVPASLVTAIWQHAAVTYDYLTSTSTFYLNGVSLGTSVGTLTTIHDNASAFYIGCDFGAAAVGNFYDGLIDDVKLWASVRTQQEILVNMQQEALATSAFLQGYWKLNGNYNDATANANTLTGTATPVFSTDVPFASPATRLDIDQSDTTAGQTYTLATTISEAATHRKTFTPAKDPQKSIAVLVASIGTGDWTITVHDGYNNTIATKTVANANMATGYFEFIFSSVWRPILNNNYHFHLTSTVADGTVTSGTTVDLETVSYRTYYQFLVEENRHQIANYLTYLVIANERYVATWEATTYNPHQIVLPAGWHVRCFTTWKEYLAIGCTWGSDVTSYDQGRIYFWDGISTTYNFFVDVPEGGVNAMLGSKGYLYVIAGYQSDLLKYEGSDVATKLKRIPLIASDKYVETYSGAITMWKSLLRYGISNSDSSTIYRGVYTYGALNVRYPESLSCDYIPSTGNYGSTVKIGLLKVVNKKLLIGYQDNIAYGVDYVDASNSPYSTGNIEFIIQDEDVVYKEKLSTVYTASCLPLASGESFNVGHKIDRATSYTMKGAESTAGNYELRQEFGGGRYREIQLKVELATTTTTSPTLLGVTYEADLLKGEQRV